MDGIIPLAIAARHSSQIEELTDNFADEYSESATYAVGDYCIHDYQLYRCTTAITTAEEWTAAHWTAVSVGAEFSELKDDKASYRIYDQYEDATASGNPVSITDAIGGNECTITTNGTKVYHFGKNILYHNIGNVVTTGAAGNETVRDFSTLKTWIGLSAGNYFYPARVSAYSINDNVISVTAGSLMGYGIAFNLPCVPGSCIIPSWTLISGSVAVKFGFYTNGVWKRSVIINSSVKYVTVQADENQCIVCIESSVQNTEVKVSNFQVEIGNVSTDFEKSIIPEIVTPISGGCSCETYYGNNTFISDESMTIAYKNQKIKKVDSDYVKKTELNTTLANYVRKDSISSWFRGKKICTFGDSITNMNQWQPFMAESLGCTYTKHGVGGCTVALSNNAGHQTDCMYMDARINDLESDADVILVWGGHNDWSERISIGSFPTDNTFTLNDSGATNTFIYAYSLMLKKLMNTYPNARIYTMTCLGGRNSDATQPQDGHYYINNLSIEDYADAVKKVSQYYGIPCIDVSSLCGINTINHVTYLSDNIHPNEAGGKLIANTVVRELLRLEPIVYSSSLSNIGGTYNVTSAN